jgi:signal transduction histidine kinase
VAAIAVPASAFGWPVWLPLSGALVALAFGVYVSRYQRQLVGSYDQIEQLAAQRHRQLEQTQAELIHSQKMKALGTLAAGIAHDFNNLLSVIRLANDFLRRGVGKDPELAEENQTIESAVEQGKRIVQSMLGYSRSNTGEPQLLSVSELVEDTLGLLTQQFLSGTRLTVELDRNAPQVRLARGCLEQILLNLIVNASDAMKGGGQLSITVRTVPLEPQSHFVLAPRPAAGYVELAVADSGPGISPEVLPRIFEPFFTTKTLGAQPGTGLGLSMIYTAAQADGLGIVLDSKPGCGATFRILIPTA